MKSLILCVLCVALLAGCHSGPRIEPIESLTPSRTPRPVETPQVTTPPASVPKPRVDETGTTLLTRYNPETDYVRQETEPGTFSAYLQNLPLMTAGSQVIAIDETLREQDDYDAVLSMEVLNKNELGAGAVAHLRAQYFYSKQDFSKIAFHLNDGFNFTFDKWRAGNKLAFVENRAAWTTGGVVSDDETNYTKYLEAYYAYSSLGSLKTDMSEVDMTDPVRIGDVFVTLGDRGRAFIVADCVTNEANGRHVILLEGGRPAQPLRVLKNTLDSALSPWFAVDVTNGLITIDGDTTLRTEPFDDGKPARYKFLTDSAGTSVGTPSPEAPENETPVPSVT